MTTIDNTTLETSSPSINTTSNFANSSLDTTIGQPIMNSTTDAVGNIDSKCSFYNATLPSINNSSINTTGRTLENNTNDETPTLENTVESVKSNKQNASNSQNEKSNDKKEKLDLSTAAVLGGASAGISAILYLKLK